jgi:glycosyltransferase involved in cell wall biosynthesis
MHVLIVHGYQLHGSGSCTYVANLAKTYASLGHSVTISCQETRTESLDYVTDATYDIPLAKPSPKEIRVFLPRKGGMLPVYKMDNFEPYDAKEIGDISFEEADDHIDVTVDRLEQYVNKCPVDFIIANHALFSPTIVSRLVKRLIEKAKIDIPYVVKIHGSGVTFTLEQHPEWIKYSLEGLMNAKKIICGSVFMKKKLFRLTNHKILPRVDIIPCGVDTKLFNTKKCPIDNKITIVFVGKILDTKGIAELVTVFPHINFGHNLKTELLIIGDGPYRETLNEMIVSLQTNDKDKYISLAKRDKFLVQEWDFEKCNIFKPLDKNHTIKYLGYKMHDELAPILSNVHIGVTPSNEHESFGIVIVEQLCSGVFPLCIDHSGPKEISDFVESTDPELGKYMRLQKDLSSFDKFLDILNKSIEPLIKYPDIRLRLNKCGSYYDWSNICKNIIDI